MRDRELRDLHRSGALSEHHLARAGLCSIVPWDGSSYINSYINGNGDGSGYGDGDGNGHDYGIEAA